MEKALTRQLGKKPKALALNVGALDKGFEWASGEPDEAAIRTASSG